MSLPVITPVFPGAVWDGTSPDRPVLSAHAPAGPYETKQLIKEVVAIESFLLGARVDGTTVTAATTLGTVIGKIAVRDTTNAIVGYIPVYGTIT